MNVMNKYRSLFVLALMAGTYAKAQIKPSGATQPSSPTQTVATVPAAYNSNSKINFVRSWEASVPFTNEADVLSTARTTAEVKQTTQYFDGLGRPLQTVVKKASPGNQDLVSMHVYDAFGREALSYLPYVQTTDNTNDGKFKLNPFSNQSGFMQSQYAGEQVFYNQTVFEESPLNRPLKTMAAGNSWAGSNRGVSMSYEINDANEVRLWNIGNNIGAVPTTTASYNAGELYRTITTDERDKKVIEYKDKEGKVVLKKVQIDNSATTNSHTGWLCTYYVYDDFGLLRFVIPPLAVEKLAGNSWSFGTNVVSELCFRYEYDGRHRMIEKKVPGAGVVQMVYDTRDRLVMVQDGFQAANNFNWICTEYDQLNRPVKTFIAEWDDTRENIQDYVNTGLNLVTIANLSGYIGGPYTLLTETYYDNYTWASGITGISASLDNSFTSSTDYISSANTSPYYAQAFTASTATRGMVTGSKVRILGTSNYVYSLTIYDDKGRPIQVQSTNHTGGTDIVSTQYDFSGKALRTHHKHIRNNGGTPVNITTVNNYDAMGRIVSTQKRINSGALKTIAVNTYNALGQLQTKELGNHPINNTPLETLDYSYNIRGWLTGINKPYANSVNENDESRKFGMELNYDYGFTQNQFNGNIAGIKWKSTGSDKQRAYGFDYDNANRLLKGDFTQNNGGWNQSAGINYDIKMGDGINYSSAYDANGNILQMQQWGLKLTASSQIDNLYYTYQSNSNKLKNVIDLNNDAQTKLGDFRTSANHPQAVTKQSFNPTGVGIDPSVITDYDYDANGNLLYDKNKDITSIAYNHLNLPEIITITGKGSISYTYDATGNKLKKVTVDNTVNPSKITTTFYVAGFVYEQVNSNAVTLQFFGHEEGRIREQKDANGNITDYVFDYMVKDHLGNVRMVLTDEQKTDIYHAGFEQQNFEQEIFINYNNIVEKPACYERTGGAIGALEEQTEQSDTKLQVVGAAKDTKPMVVGVGKVLKVMAGDHVDARVYGWYSREIQNETAPTELTPIQELLLSFFGGGISSMSESGGAINGNNGLLASGIGQFLENQDNYNEDGAYLNWILLDEEQFKLVQSGSGFESFMKGVEGQDGCASTVLQANNGDGIDIKKNGYLYIYVSNTNKQYPVYFDDLHIEHIRGSLTEETHYYPFGLTMSGISSKAATNAPAQKYKYNDKELQSEEFSDGSGLEWTDFGARMYDNQTGRWMTIDPWAEKYERQSQYNGMNNNPIIFNDPTGKGGELTVQTDENGKLYLKVTAKIYVYSYQMNKKTVDKYAAKIKSDIISQWSNPTETDENGKPLDESAKAGGNYNGQMLNVVWDISVEGVTTEQAEALAKNNTSASVNFMGLVNDGSASEVLDGNNSARIDVSDLNKNGSTTAAHEFGHMLGYDVKKGNVTANGKRDAEAIHQNDTDHHAWRQSEPYYIMSRSFTADASKRRVDPIEYSRLNGGKGLTIKSSRTPVLIVHPNQPITNTLVK